MIKKKYNNTQEMLNDLINNQQEKEKRIQKISEKQLGKILKAFRLKNGMTQIDIAKKMKCDQSSISKLEQQNDNNFTVGELQSYLKALNMDLGIAIREKKDIICLIKTKLLLGLKKIKGVVLGCLQKLSKQIFMKNKKAPRGATLRAHNVIKYGGRSW